MPLLGTLAFRVQPCFTLPHPTACAEQPLPHTLRVHSLPAVSLVPACSSRCPLPTDIRLPTLYESWEGCVAQFGPGPCLGRRVGSAYEYLTYEVRGLEGIWPRQPGCLPGWPGISQLACGLRGAQASWPTLPGRLLATLHVPGRFGCRRLDEW